MKMNCWSTGTKLEAHRSRWRHSKTANYLKDKYRGQQKSFQQILEEQIDETEFLESHFREAIKEMENKDLNISRIPPKTKTGRNRKGVDYQDVIIFNK